MTAHLAAMPDIEMPPVTALQSTGLLATSWPSITPCFLLGQSSIEQVLDRSWPWSVWLTIVVSSLVILTIGMLYFTESGRASRGRRALLAALRIVAIGIVFWMLAGWNMQRYESDLPELVIAIDDSASMQTADGRASTIARDSRSTRWETAGQALLKAWSASGGQLQKQYRTKLFALSDGARPIAMLDDRMSEAIASLSPDGEQSRLGDGLNQILQRQSGRPTAAIVLISDGIVTAGAPLEEAVAAARRLSVPIYCVATGQQMPQPDLGLADLLADDAVYLGDRVNVQVSVTGTDIAMHRTVVQLRDMESGQIVDSAPVEISPTRSVNNVQLSYVPSAAGNSVIKLEIPPAPGEKNVENNALERIIEVRDQTLRILLIQKSPSFEYRFLKTLLERTSELGETGRRAFEVDVVLQDADAAHVAQDKTALRLVPGDRDTIAGYHAIIIGQIDPTLVASSTQQLIVDQVTSAGCGCIFICHPDFNPAQLAGWPLGGLLPIDSTARPQTAWKFDGNGKRWQPTRLGLTALPMQLADGSSATELWRTLPGPEWYFVPGALKPGAQILAGAVPAISPEATGGTLPGEDAISSVNMPPLLISQFAGTGRVVMQTTDETYRWISYRGSDAVHQRYWIQMLRWLSRGKLNRKEQSELSIQPRSAQVGEPIQFSVRLSAEAAAALNTAPVKVLVERIGGDARVIELPRTQNASLEYRWNESKLPTGSYRASLKQPTDENAASVTFTITAPPGEQANLRSDWRAMQSLSEQTRGKFLTADKIDSLLAQLPKGTPVRRGALPPIPLWNTAWVALLFVALITAEWLLRRAANML